MPRPAQVELGGDHEVVEVAGVVGRDRTGFTAVEEPLSGVLALSDKSNRVMPIDNRS